MTHRNDNRKNKKKFPSKNFVSLFFSFIFPLAKISIQFKVIGEVSFYNFKFFFKKELKMQSTLVFRAKKQCGGQFLLLIDLNRLSDFRKKCRKKQSIKRWAITNENSSNLNLEHVNLSLNFNFFPNVSSNGNKKKFGRGKKLSSQCQSNIHQWTNFDG